MHDALRRRLAATELAHRPALAHDDNAVGHAENLRQLGRNHQDAHAAAREPIDQIVDLALRADVDAARRLVEDEQPRRLQHRPGHEDLLLVAAR